MKVKEINDCLFRGNIAAQGLFPHLETLALTAPVFRIDFGLEKLPHEEGVLLIRGARQYGKSTWLEAKLRESALSGGPERFEADRIRGVTMEDLLRDETW